MGSAVDDVALHAIHHGIAVVARADFQPGEPRALALDVLKNDAAVLVVQLEPEGTWTTDIVRFVALDGQWTDSGSSGGTYGDLPFELDMTAPPEIVLFTRGTCGFDDRSLAYAGGFLTGPVDQVELLSSVGARRVPIGVNRQTFVILAPAEHDEPGRLLRSKRREGPHVRAYVGGALVDDSAEWHRDEEPAFAEALTVAEALAAPPGETVTIRGVLLQIDGEPALLCDEVDSSAVPPSPLGGAIILPGPPGPPSWQPGSPGVHMLMTVATGFIRDRTLHPPTDQRMNLDG